MFEIKHSTAICLTLATSMTMSVAVAEPVDLTGLTCLHQMPIGPVTRDFYGDVAIRECMRSNYQNCVD